MNLVPIIIGGETIDVEKGSTLESLSKRYQDQFSFEIIIAKVNGILKELHEPITGPCEVEFFDLTNREAHRIFLNGLIYLTVYAGKQLFGPDSTMKVNHSIDKGLYIETNHSITEEDAIKIQQKMKELVQDDLPIDKVTTSRLDAIRYFETMNDPAKVGIMKYNTNTYITLYRLGEMYDYFYSLMPGSTEVLDHFELTYLNETGFVLRYPTIYLKEQIKPYEHRPTIFHLFKQCRDWGKLMHLENVVDLNEYVANSSIEELIRMDEMIQTDRLLHIAQEIATRAHRAKIVLIAGPSSSGKTTTCNRLGMCLKSFGISPKMVSMDDYFVDRKDTPRDEHGNLDFERLESVDLALFDKTMKTLLDGEEVEVPTYNFVHGMKEYKDRMKLEENEILLIEGIHALNPKILENIPREDKVTIYLSALTELNIDLHTRVSTTDNRLLRRIVRDNRTRGHKIEDTLRSWVKVREGEEKYIFPYQDQSDYAFNTALIYELGVLKTYVEPLLYSIEPSSPYYNEAKRLLDFLRLFLPIPSEGIPKDSILREFIGGSCFKV